MLTIIVTGAIGSGKSAVCSILRKKGIPVYDSDSRTKQLYDSVPGLVRRLEKELGASFSRPDGTLDRGALAGILFSSAESREKLEAVVYPLVLEDFEAWRRSQTAPFVVLESAIILSKPIFDGVADVVVAVTAPEEVRLRRLIGRGLSEDDARRRMASQSLDYSGADVVISNGGSLVSLSREVDDVFFGKNSYICNLQKQTTQNMKTDLQRILSVRGQRGLFNYIAQSRQGAIVEALDTKKRLNVSASAGITSMADISIYTSEEEVKLQEVFLKMKEVLGDAPAPSHKASDAEFKALFEKALPDYDHDRFYVSHMKKVSEWYNVLKEYASLDFLTDEEREAEAGKEEA